ncbi:MAG: adenylosuccinate synthetase [Acetatifactor sp.]|nr:adenylosuccinate synthetase [Acetatifactor sp.]
MVEVKAVIGKNFGDEGKGQTVNLLCRGKNALVVRHNGGAQSGHTVEEGDFRFVFHQLGSGSYQGCPTYWAGTFLPDLLKLGEEMEDYARTVEKDTRALPVHTIYADPDCACTTVCDVLLNSLTEQLRGKDKHGSCGMGIFEAVLRTKEKSFVLRLRDFEGTDSAKIAGMLRHIRDNYTIPRVRTLRDQYPSQFIRPEILRWTELIMDNNVLHNSAEIMCENYRKYVALADWERMAEQYRIIVFESGQGLMLDWDNEEYSPHLTASHTGMKNVAALLKELEHSQDISTSYSLEVIYVSRTYITRHGAGRLDHECPREAINPEMTDRTNIFNPWQDHLRYARHPSGNEFFRYIRKDLEWLKQLLPHLPFSVALYLTHLDETQGKVIFSDGEVSFEDFRRYCGEYAPELVRMVYEI